MSGLARVAMACAIGAFMFAMSCRVVANEAPFQVAALSVPQAAPDDRAQTPSVSEPFEISRNVSPGFAEKWNVVERAMRDDIAAAERCRADDAACNDATRKLNTLIASARELSGRARLGVINRAVNLAIASVSDMAQHGVDDVWSAPLETLASGKGDCEDYAILKIAILRAAGIGADDLRLLVVRDPASSEGHAVAAARLDGRWLILDNRRFTLVDAAHSEYRPVHALRPVDDNNGVAWAQGPSGSGAAPVLL